jgi:predicted RNA-binding Zn ribbon-like protein
MTAPAWTDEDLLVALANTNHAEQDELGVADRFAAWWSDFSGEAHDARQHVCAPGELDSLRAYRGLIRRLALRNNGIVLDPPTPPNEPPFRLSWSDGAAFVPVNSVSTASQVAARVALALVRASARPGWPRLKACRGEDCRWVFVDASRNASRQWCIVAGCGNRAKVAAFRARQADRRAQR